MMEYLPEAPWVTAMRRHYYEHGFYRQADLIRLLGAPGDSVTIGKDGKPVYRHAASPGKDDHA